jgi:hypothetical protein
MPKIDAIITNVEINQVLIIAVTRCHCSIGSNKVVWASLRIMP